MLIKIKKLHKDAKIPTYAHISDAGMDLYSMEDYNIRPSEAKIFMLGFALEFPEGYVALIKDKGGLSAIHHIHSVGGVFDSGYRGEYSVNLINLGKKLYQIKKSNKIAQLVIFPIAKAEFVEANELSKTSRGAGRHGSTGR